MLGRTSFVNSDAENKFFSITSLHTEKSVLRISSFPHEPPPPTLLMSISIFFHFLETTLTTFLHSIGFKASAWTIR